MKSSDAIQLALDDLTDARDQVMEAHRRWARDYMRENPGLHVEVTRNQKGGLRAIVSRSDKGTPEGVKDV